jgi:hypothetical protein
MAGFLDSLAVDTQFKPRACLPGDDVTSDVTAASNTIRVGKLLYTALFLLMTTSCANRKWFAAAK